MDGKKRKGEDSNGNGAGGIGFLVKEYSCEIIEVMKDKIRRQHMNKGARRAGSKNIFS